ncbi:MAG: DNA polymerase III subunit delta' [Hyphomicrobium sp.]|nr:DNA polymerase III subunit delta' [Hyphomicrobium sp.]
MARAALSADAEVLPEADRLDGFAHPRETRAVIGHGDAERIFAEALSSERMHHAWLITGAAGIGKATLAYRFARAALAREGERDLFGDALDVAADSSAYRQVTALSHPGLLVIRRGYDTKAKRFAQSIAVDDVRRLKSFLAMSAEEGGRRVIIVDSADELNINAANALLKSLEEPPSRTVFLIVSSAPGRLLATIRSRCRMLPLAPLTADDLRRAVQAALTAASKAEPSPDVWADMERISGGSVRRALTLVDTGGFTLQARIDKILASLPKLDMAAAHAISDDLHGAANDAKFVLFGGLLADTLARLIRAEATGQGSAADVSLAHRLIGPARLASFAELWETLARERAEVMQLNLDRKSLILTSLMRLESASRTPS